MTAVPRETPHRPPARLNLLGGFILTSFGEPVVLPISAQRLLAFLALHLRPLQRPYVAGALWPERSRDRAGASLRSALWRVRSAGLARTVQATSSHLSVTDQLSVDARDVLATVRRLQESTAGQSPEDLDLYLLTGELLPDWYDDWVIIERERLRQLRLRGLETACGLLRDLGHYDRAVEAGLAAVRDEPLRESAHRAVISVYLAEGNYSEAIRQYRWYQQFLRQELGIRPSPKMAALVGQVSPRVVA